MATYQQEKKTQRYYWIDALRGIAAIVIVIFHYHHFYLTDASARPSIPDIETFPYAGVLHYFYSEVAANAVELFWLISGFVFAHVYTSRQTTLWRFSVARFARLYPLHIATLLFAALIQFISLNAAGHWQIYENNDLKHFGLQIIMASNWTSLSHGLSFNGPIWSVSLEIVVYAFFFLCLPLLKKATAAASILLCAVSWFWFFVEPIQLPLIRNSVFEVSGYFFLGSLLFSLRPDKKLSQLLITAAVIATLSILGIYLDIKQFIVASAALAFVTVAACLDQLAPRIGSKLSLLGDISYSIYLVHVPLQMIVLLIADLAFDGTRDFANSYYTLPIYLIASIFMATAAYKHFEKPSGILIRNLCLKNIKQG